MNEITWHSEWEKRSNESLFDILPKVTMNTLIRRLADKTCLCLRNQLTSVKPELFLNCHVQFDHRSGICSH